MPTQFSVPPRAGKGPVPPPRGCRLAHARRRLGRSPNGNLGESQPITLCQGESPAPLRWSEPHVLLSPDKPDTNDFPGVRVFRSADYRLGQFRTCDEDEEGPVETELGRGRAGLHWAGQPRRFKFLARGEPGQPGGYLVLTARAPVAAGAALAPGVTA